MGEVIKLNLKAKGSRLKNLKEFSETYAVEALEHGHVSTKDGLVTMSREVSDSYSSILATTIEVEEIQKALKDYPRVFSVCCLAWIGAISKLPYSGESLTEIARKPAMPTKAH